MVSAHGDSGGTTAATGTAIILHAGDAAAVDAPFKLVANGHSQHGQVLELAQGDGSDDGRGRAVINVDVNEPGPRRLWLRALWRDSCANSVGVAIGATDPLVAGQDASYDLWHWVDGGTWDLPAGTHPLTLSEREDGVAVDMALLTDDLTFVPTAAAALTSLPADLRRFSDSFERSPGHGSPGWDFRTGTWDIEFSLDPNRIPNQFSLHGEAADGNRALALIDGPPWRGFRLRMHVFAERAATFGLALLRQGEVAETGVVTVAETAQNAVWTSKGSAAGQAPMPCVPGQWHSVIVERWGWSALLVVDGVVLDVHDLSPAAGTPALLVTHGTVLFDDVSIQEVPWKGENGRDMQVPWNLAQDAKWFRPTGTQTGIRGLQGTISLDADTWPVRAVALSGRNAAVTVGPAALVNDAGSTAGGALWLPKSPDMTTVSLTVGSETIVDRVAIAYGVDPVETFRIGPYDFESPTVLDPSDYHDFTPEELAEIRRSPDADVLRRKPNQMALVGTTGDYCVWTREWGSWDVKNGALTGTGRGARLRLSQWLECAVALRLRMRLVADNGAAMVALGEEDGNAATVALVPGNADDGGQADLTLTLEQPTEWHQVEVQLDDASLRARINNGPWSDTQVERGVGGGILLHVPRGRAIFDDVEVVVPRRGAFVAENGSARYYAFDRRESDWVRSGDMWADHGGIACALASNWISLIAPRSSGTLTNRFHVENDVLVAFNVEENSEWYGWNRNPTHTHHPFDNIRVVLEDAHGGAYSLEVNARNRRATVLTRNGEDVVVVRQDSSFPIHYEGGHAPYGPRRNRIRLIKQGDTLRAHINGREILTYRDPEPLAIRTVSLGGHHTHINFSNIVVRRLQ